MSEVVHLAGKCRIVEQRHGILVPTPGGELKVVRACGRADVHLHEEEGDLQIVDISEQLGGSFAVRVGKEIAQVSGAEQVSAAAPTLSVSAETELKGLRLPARTDDEFTAVHTGEGSSPSVPATASPPPGNAGEHRADRRSTRRRFPPPRNSSRPDCHPLKPQNSLALAGQRLTGSLKRCTEPACAAVFLP